jgi:hypothetical protein
MCNQNFYEKFMIRISFCVGSLNSQVLTVQFSISIYAWFPLIQISNTLNLSDITSEWFFLCCVLSVNTYQNVLSISNCVYNLFLHKSSCTYIHWFMSYWNQIRSSFRFYNFTFRNKRKGNTYTIFPSVMEFKKFMSVWWRLRHKHFWICSLSGSPWMVSLNWQVQNMFYVNNLETWLSISIAGSLQLWAGLQG